MTFTTRLITSSSIALFFSISTLAQTTDHSGHDMGQMDETNMNQVKRNHGAMMNTRARHMIEATGVVEKISIDNSIVRLSHDAIPAINWPSMTMDFAVAETVDINSLKKGQIIQFTLHRAEDGNLPLVELCPTQSRTVIEGLCAPDKEHGHGADGTDHGRMINGDMSHEGMKD
jgi:Cu/Ag efflux protein CusF